MKIKELRKKTGLTQVDFAKKYNIPIDTIKGWESDVNSKRHRKCPDYVLFLLELVIDNDLIKK